MKRDDMSAEPTPKLDSFGGAGSNAAHRVAHLLQVVLDGMEAPEYSDSPAEKFLFRGPLRWLRSEVRVAPPWRHALTAASGRLVRGSDGLQFKHNEHGGFTDYSSYTFGPTETDVRYSTGAKWFVSACCEVLDLAHRLEHEAGRSGLVAGCRDDLERLIELVRGSAVNYHEKREFGDLHDLYVRVRDVSIAIARDAERELDANDGPDLGQIDRLIAQIDEFSGALMNDRDLDHHIKRFISGHLREIYEGLYGARIIGYAPLLKSATAVYLDARLRPEPWREFRKSSHGRKFAAVWLGVMTTLSGVGALPVLLHDDEAPLPPIIINMPVDEPDTGIDADVAPPNRPGNDDWSAKRPADGP